MATSLDVKRLVDIAVGALLAVAIAPVSIATGIAVWRDLGRPLLFSQSRPGLHGRPFRLRKFRTMATTTDADGRLLSDADRLTPVGQRLRRWSLDELPELWNVLRGDMSLVGPRPLLMEYLHLYSNEQMRRQEMRPGLTGLAQVRGRNDQSWEERLALDVWYVDNWSLWLDVKILAATVVTVVTGEGLSASGHATMPRFGGGADE